jgi:hypothetical protein
MALAEAPISGQFISSFGGVLVFAPYQGTRTPEAASTRIYVDCKNWSLNIKSYLDDTTHTGSFGGQSVEKTGESWTFAASIIWDIRNPPDMIQKYQGLAPDLNFNKGCRMAFVLGSDQNYPNDVSATYYFAPSVKVLSQTPIIDANSKKMVAIDIAGVGNSRIFKLPAEQALLTAYNTHLATRNLNY